MGQGGHPPNIRDIRGTANSIPSPCGLHSLCNGTPPQTHAMARVQAYNTGRDSLAGQSELLSSWPPASPPALPGTPPTLSLSPSISLSLTYTHTHAQKYTCTPQACRGHATWQEALLRAPSMERRILACPILAPNSLSHRDEGGQA